MKWSTLVATALPLTGELAWAIHLDLNSQDSIKSVASTIVFDMMSYYNGNLSGKTPGILPGPPPTTADLDRGYFWWEAGAMWGTLMDYWYYTGDTSYNDVVMQGMLFQTGENHDYLPANQTKGMGNDDQGFWAMSAMTAAELNFPNPPASEPQWLALAQAVFNTQAPRLDTQCGGGLRWQAFQFLNGYNYKNSIANGCFFNLAARLAAYTGNMTYAQYAEDTWTWMRSVKFMDDKYMVYDGAHVESNCTDINNVQFSYNAGVFTLGAATMYNLTNGSAIWKERLDGILGATLQVFFPNDTAFEVSCEAALIHCTIDMYSEKAFLTRWLAATTKVAPYTFGAIMPKIRTSAAAAAEQCCGGDNGRMCGLSWSKKSQWDGTQGVGQQMAALEVIQSNLITQVKAPLTNSTGGTSIGDPSAGTTNPTDPMQQAPLGTKDKAGAGIATAVALAGICSMFGWMSF